MLNDLLLFINILLCVFVVAGSFIYAKTVKSKYRWVKLFWGLEMLVYLLALISTILGSKPSITLQYLTMMLPLSALAYGIVVAFSRVKEATLYKKLEDKLNGDLQKWIDEQEKNLPLTLPKK